MKPYSVGKSEAVKKITLSPPNQSSIMLSINNNCAFVLVRGTQGNQSNFFTIHNSNCTNHPVSSDFSIPSFSFIPLILFVISFFHWPPYFLTLTAVLCSSSVVSVFPSISFLYLMQSVEFLWNNGDTRELGSRGLGGGSWKHLPL